MLPNAHTHMYASCMCVNVCGTPRVLCLGAWLHNLGLGLHKLLSAFTAK